MQKADAVDWHQTAWHLLVDLEILQMQRLHRGVPMVALAVRRDCEVEEENWHTLDQTSW